MKRYKRLAKEFLNYHVVAMYTEEGRRAVEKLFKEIINTARADVRRKERIWNGQEKRAILNLAKLKERKPQVILWR